MSDNNTSARNQLIIDVVLIAVKNLWKLIAGLNDGSIDPATIDLDELKNRLKNISRPPIKR